jgi:hypothetical protein
MSDAECLSLSIITPVATGRVVSALLLTVFFMFNPRKK